MPGLYDFLNGLGIPQSPPPPTQGGLLGALQKQGILGPAYGNPLLMRQFANQQAAFPREKLSTLQQGMDLGAGLLGMVPGIGDVLGLAADANRFRTEPESRTPLNFGLSALGLLPFIPNITVYHGSPHKFDKFDINARNTNSGGSSFGKGVNLSADKTHAKVYGKNVYKVDLPDEDIATFIKWEKPVSQDLAKQIPPIDFNKPIPFGGGAFIDRSPDGEWLLKANSNHAGFRMTEKEVMRMFGDQNTGEQVYRRLVAALGDEAAASKWLLERGYKGIENTTERNARNFVVFDDKIPKIIGRD